MFLGDVLVRGIDIHIATRVPGHIAVREHYVIAFFYQLEIGFVEPANRFPEQAAP